MNAGPGRFAGLIFDVDGTLVDTNYVHALCWWQAFSQFGHTVPMARLHRTVGLGSERLVDHVMDRRLTDAQRAEIVAAHGTLFATWWDLVRPLPGAEALLRWCWDRQMTTVVVSSSRGRDLEAMLDVLGRPDVDLVLSGDDVSRDAPDAGLLSTALRRADLSPDNAALVGDSVWDVEAATEAGLPCLGLTSGGTSAQELRAAGAVEVFADAGDLLETWRTAEPAGIHAQYVP